jgi:hypothetical protein
MSLQLLKYVFFSWKPNLKCYFDAISELWNATSKPIPRIPSKNKLHVSIIVLDRNFFPRVSKPNLVKCLASLLPFFRDLLIFGTPALHALLELEQSVILSFVLFKQLFNTIQSVLHPQTLFADVVFNWSLALRSSVRQSFISDFCCWHSVSLGNCSSWIGFNIQVPEPDAVVSLSDAASENFRFSVLDVESRFGDELPQEVVFQATLQ